MRRRGFTLMEIAVYAFLLVLAGAAVAGIFAVTRQTSHSTTSSYLVTGSAETAMRWLREELRETALASIRVSPEDGGEETPGLSFVSARAFGDSARGELLVNRYGAPQWDKHVFYTLETEAGHNVGKLVRWEQEIAEKNLLPVPSTLAPSSPTGGAERRVVLHNVIAPNVTVEAQGGDITSDKFGGFRAQFIRRSGGTDGEESLTSVNPTFGNPQDNTRLLEVELKILQERGYNPNYYTIRFRVTPMH